MNIYKPSNQAGRITLGGLALIGALGVGGATAFTAYQKLGKTPASVETALDDRKGRISNMLDEIGGSDYVVQSAPQKETPIETATNQSLVDNASAPQTVEIPVVIHKNPENTLEKILKTGSKSVADVFTFGKKENKDVLLAQSDAIAESTYVPPLQEPLTSQVRPPQIASVSVVDTTLVNTPVLPTRDFSDNFYALQDNMASDVVTREILSPLNTPEINKTTAAAIDQVQTSMDDSIFNPPQKQKVTKAFTYISPLTIENSDREDSVFAHQNAIADSIFATLSPTRKKQDVKAFTYLSPLTVENFASEDSIFARQNAVADSIFAVVTANEKKAGLNKAYFASLASKITSDSIALALQLKEAKEYDLSVREKADSQYAADMTLAARTDSLRLARIRADSIASSPQLIASMSDSGKNDNALPGAYGFLTPTLLKSKGNVFAKGEPNYANADVDAPNVTSAKTDLPEIPPRAYATVLSKDIFSPVVENAQGSGSGIVEEIRPATESVQRFYLNIKSGDQLGELLEQKLRRSNVIVGHDAGAILWGGRIKDESGSKMVYAGWVNKTLARNGITDSRNIRVGQNLECDFSDLPVHLQDYLAPEATMGANDCVFVGRGETVSGVLADFLREHRIKPNHVLYGKDGFLENVARDNNLTVKQLDHVEPTYGFRISQESLQKAVDRATQKNLHASIDEIGMRYASGEAAYKIADDFAVFGTNDVHAIGLDYIVDHGSVKTSRFNRRALAAKGIAIEAKVNELYQTHGNFNEVAQAINAELSAYNMQVSKKTLKKIVRENA